MSIKRKFIAIIALAIAIIFSLGVIDSNAAYIGERKWLSYYSWVGARRKLLLC